MYLQADTKIMQHDFGENYSSSLLLGFWQDEEKANQHEGYNKRADIVILEAKRVLSFKKEDKLSLLEYVAP